MKQNSSNITVYTCITGGKDELLEHFQLKKKTEANWIAFMDKPGLSPTWTIKRAYDRFKDVRRNSRAQKILSHQFIDTEYSIYIDGNIKLLHTPQELIEKHLKDYDLAVFKHPSRDCIYDESIQCAVSAKDDPEVIIEQVKLYEDRGFAKHKGLAECGIILRRNTPKVQEFNNAWWSEFCRHSSRDQISFMYAVDQVGIPINIVNDLFVDPDGTLQYARKESGCAEIIIHKHYENS